MDGISIETQKPIKPAIFVKSIVFNDGTVLSLENNSIVVFTGANNSGKSQVLRDIEQRIENPKKDSVIVTNVSVSMQSE